MILKSGTSIQNGKYIIEKKLGQGGFGITYLGVQKNLNRRVAIKEFFMKDFCHREEGSTQVTVGTESSRQFVEQYKRKFVKEAQTIAQLEYNHIIRIYDVFEENGTAYYVMEYLPGDDLKARIPQGGMCEQQAVAYIQQIADALDFIHQRKILHLDVKPANILFRKEKELVLIDFGISKHYDKESNAETSSTPAGISEGYAPLEQYDTENIRKFSPATDIYALGATLYHLLIGKRPPNATQLLKGLPPLDKSLSKEVSLALQQSMRSAKEDRPQSIGEFLGLLDAPVADNGTSNDEDDEDTDVKNLGKKQAEGKENSKEADKPDEKEAAKKADNADEYKVNDDEGAQVKTDGWKNIWKVRNLLAGLAALAAVVIGIRMLGDDIHHEDGPDGGVSRDSLTVSYSNGKWGFVNSDKEKVIPYLFDMAHPFSDGLSLVVQDNEYRYLDKQGTTVLHLPDSDFAEPFSDGMARVRIQGKWGVIDREGKYLVSPVYDDLVICDNHAVIIKSGDKYGVIDLDDNVRTMNIYDFLDEFHDGLAWAKMDGRYGYINKKGKEVIPFVYEGASRFMNGTAYVYNNNKYSLIDTTGTVIVSDSYDGLDWAADGLYRFRINNKYGYIDKAGHVIAKPVYDFLSPFVYDERAYFELNGKCGIMDKNGHEIIPAKYDSFFGFFKNGYLMGWKGKKKGFIDIHGNEVVPFIYEDVDADIMNGVVGVQLNGKWGLVNVKGETIVPCTYDYIYPSEYKYRQIRKGGKEGLIDLNGKVMLEPVYDNVWPLSDEMIYVIKDGKAGIMNPKGETLIPFIYESIGEFKDGLARCKYMDRWGYINQKGESVIPFIYDKAESFREGVAKVIKDGKNFIINRKNQVL